MLYEHPDFHEFDITAIRSDIIQEYSDHAASDSSIRPNQKPFYLKWVNSFLKDRGVHFPTAVTQPEIDNFSRAISVHGRNQGWQVQQAIAAVRHYGQFLQSLDRGGAPLSPEQALEEFHSAARLKHYSPRTEKSYALRIRQFLAFAGKPPRDLGAPDARRFLAYLLSPSIRVGELSCVQYPWLCPPMTPPVPS